MIPLMKWHECKECGKVTIRVIGERGRYRGEHCAACYQWIRDGGKAKELETKICPETGETIKYKRYKGSHKRFINRSVALVNKRRRNSRERRQDPEKRAKEYASNEKRYYRYISEGRCPRCGDIPDDGVLCENCKDRLRICNYRNRRD